MLKSFINLIFPKICYACGKSISGPIENICLSCRTEIPKIHQLQKGENPVEKIFWGRLPLVKATSYLRFEKNSRVMNLLHALKYKGVADIGVTLGELTALDLGRTSFFNNIDLLLPIPIHPHKKRQRGYNQSQLITEGITNITKIKHAENAIEKTVNTESQTRKNRYQRYKNVNQTFNILDSKLLKNKHILLIDDVVTTGSTIEACGNQLREIEGVQLSLLTIACTY